LEIKLEATVEGFDLIGLIENLFGLENSLGSHDRIILREEMRECQVSCKLNLDRRSKRDATMIYHLAAWLQMETYWERKPRNHAQPFGRDRG
jgi:hypothetical protein